MTIKRVGPLSCAKIAAAIYAVLGLIFGALFSIVALVGVAVSGTQRTPNANSISPLLGGTIGVAAFLIFPILYGIIGFVFAWIGAWFYNLAASKIGGIEIDIS